MSGDESAPRTRRKPRQARARATVAAILEGAARVFRREGWDATTNRIAEEAGVGIGSLYEYFPDKEALLVALAEEHVAVAEARIEVALARVDTPTDVLLEELQRAIMASHRYPSQALDLVADVPRVCRALQARVADVQTRLVATLTEHATRAGHRDARVRAIAAFEAIGRLTATASCVYPELQEALAAHYLTMARGCLEAQAGDLHSPQLGDTAR